MIGIFGDHLIEPSKSSIFTIKARAMRGPRKPAKKYLVNSNVLKSNSDE